MKLKLIAAVAVLAVCIALGLFALNTVDNDTQILGNLAQRALAAAETGDRADAMLLMDEFLEQLDVMRLRLELITLHEVVNDISKAARGAKVRLEQDQLDEFAYEMVQLQDDLAVLYEQQRLSAGNLF